MSHKTIHVFYACDENFLKYTVVSITSLIENASKKYNYKIHILHTDIHSEAKKLISDLKSDRFDITFDDVTSYLLSLKDKLPIRDYYTKTTYFRLFIAEMYPRIQKAVYIDSDTVIQGDISEFYNEDVSKYYVGACVERVMVQTDIFGTYVEKVIGIDRNKFFNAGVLLINCKKFRSEYVLEQFIELLGQYSFVVTQDEDYLNIICKDKVKYIDSIWNTQTYLVAPYSASEAKLIHYIMQNKPWHYKGCMYEDVFWRYAEKTACYEDILKELNGYTEEERQRDAEAIARLAQIAQDEIDREDNYLNAVVRASLAPDRLQVLKKIELYEREGRFDEDVEDDPPAPVLTPDKIEYIKKDPVSKIKTVVAYAVAHMFVNKQIKAKNLIIKEIKGLENINALQSGAIITCNHFNAFDSFAMQLTYEASSQKKRKFYRIIREGNYTGFPGFYGFLMRNCDTLPLSSNSRTMRKFVRATDTILQNGDFILVYPEQSMWWNYRKPKPLKEGSFSMAVKNKVPVLPCFITMNDSKIMGGDGFFVQEYTVHISPAIYPDPSKTYRENAQYVMEENYRVWKEIYEKEYGIPLTYTTEKA